LLGTSTFPLAASIDKAFYRTPTGVFSVLPDRRAKPAGGASNAETIGFSASSPEQAKGLA